MKKIRDVNSYKPKQRKVFERDGFKCRKCESPYKLSMDHIVPKSMGGKDGLYNLQTLCSKCNFAKGSQHE